MGPTPTFHLSVRPLAGALAALLAAAALAGCGSDPEPGTSPSGTTSASGTPDASAQPSDTAKASESPAGGATQSATAKPTTAKPTTAKPGNGSQVPVADFKSRMSQPNTTIVDVRTKEEFASGHLPGAINIDVSKSTFKTQVSYLDLETPYAVYCQTGNRSARALKIMKDVGFANVYGLEGGIVAWKAAGEPVVTGG